VANKTGLGLNALIPPKEAQKETTAPVAAKPKAKRPQNEKAKPQAVPEEVERRTTWVREDYMVRLETLKLRERARLRKQGKRVSVASLIDEALEQYLDKKGV